jgi:hypothetical protein
MLALGRLNTRYLTLKRTAARGCSVPLPDILTVSNFGWQQYQTGMPFARLTRSPRRRSRAAWAEG